MKAVSGKELAKRAEEKGWSLTRIAGSHHIYTMVGRIERIVILVHGSQALKKGATTEPDEDHSTRRSRALAIYAQAEPDTQYITLIHVDFDADGRLVNMPIEHAKTAAQIQDLTFQEIVGTTAA
jgi:predicted RNA binding protein YcfA (HicA-like mRNA interferase family)